jgi:nucleoside-diphosphate-sugar epimerase
MKILVTGAAGRVGRYVLDELRDWHEVTAADIRPPATGASRNVELDITDLNSCRELVAGVEAVIHLAAIPNPLHDPPERVMRINTLGLWNMLQASAEAGVQRFVQASTDSALGFVFRRQALLPLSLPIDEDHPLRPQDPYGLSKAIGESICWSFAQGWGIETVCVRICRVIFPDDTALNQSLLDDPSLMAKGLWVYVDARDAARAFRLAAETPGLRQVAIFAAANESYARAPTANLITEHYPDLVALSARLPGHASFISNARARALLGWEPKFSWRDVAR